MAEASKRPATPGLRVVLALAVGLCGLGVFGGAVLSGQTTTPKPLEVTTPNGAVELPPGLADRIAIDSLQYGGVLRGHTALTGDGTGLDAGKECLVLVSGNFKGVAASDCTTAAKLAEQPLVITEGQPDESRVGAALLPSTARSVTVNGNPVDVSPTGVVTFAAPAGGKISVVSND